MESGQLVHVFSSWEVIASCLLLIFLLPLVFFVASARSPARRPFPARAVGARAGKGAPRPAAKKGAPAPDDEPPRRGRPAASPEESEDES